MDNNDSIDGLGLTFDDLKPTSQLKAVYKVLRAQLLSPTERAEIVTALDNAKNLSDEHQAVLRRAIGATKSTKKEK